ncbi:VOC family protein [Vibrio albus]|nr:VOC family protein [Vibrio albus]
MSPMFSSLGVLNVDHYAVTTRDIIATLQDFLSIPNAKLLRGPGQNPAQNVNYAFVELNGMGVVEILSPLNSDSPILSHLNAGGGAYHLCYAVQDLDRAIDIAQQQFSAKLVVEPRSDGAFDGRRVAFLVHPIHGLFELLEAYPNTLKFEPQASSTDVANIQSSDNAELLTIYNAVVGVSETQIGQVSMQTNPEWDSFKHLLLIMEIEKQFEVNISAEKMAKLDSLAKIQAYLAEK